MVSKKAKILLSTQNTNGVVFVYLKELTKNITFVIDKSKINKEVLNDLINSFKDHFDDFDICVLNNINSTIHIHEILSDSLNEILNEQYFIDNGITYFIHELDEIVKGLNNDSFVEFMERANDRRLRRRTMRAKNN